MPKGRSGDVLRFGYVLVPIRRADVPVRGRALAVYVRICMSTHAFGRTHADGIGSIVLMKRQCVTCKETKASGEFSTRKGGDGYRKSCKVCHRPGSAAYRRLRWARRPAEMTATRKRWEAANPDKVRAMRRKSQVKRAYGLDWETYQRLNEQHGGLCGICRKASTNRWRGVPRSLSVDHSHSTGAVRGLLCECCNLMLGYANDNIEVLEAAIRYLKRHAAGEQRDEQAV